MRACSAIDQLLQGRSDLATMDRAQELAEQFGVVTRISSLLSLPFPMQQQ